MSHYDNVQTFEIHPSIIKKYMYDVNCDKIKQAILKRQLKEVEEALIEAPLWIELKEEPLAEVISTLMTYGYEREGDLRFKYYPTPSNRYIMRSLIKLIAPRCIVACFILGIGFLTYRYIF